MNDIGNSCRPGCKAHPVEAWRVGRKVGRTIYKGDTLIGVMDTPELAAEVVEAVNAAKSCDECIVSGMSAMDP